MEQDDEAESFTGYEGDAGSVSDEENDPSSDSIPEGKTELAAASEPVAGDNSGSLKAAAVEAGAMPFFQASDILVMGYHTIHNIGSTDLPSYVREHSATLTFPEKLMLALMHVDRSAAKSGKRIDDFPIAWTKDGNAFVIRDKGELCSDWLPVFFQQAKFSSFTRKLYRWGFRQVKSKNKSSSHTTDIFFGNEHFQRDDKSQLTNMRSVTAIKSKREQRKVLIAEGGSASDATSQQGSSQHVVSLMESAQSFQHLQQSYMAPMPGLQAAFPPSAISGAGPYDMSNAFMQQAQIPFAMNLFNAEPFAPPSNHYQEASANTSTFSPEYIRQLQQLAGLSNEAPFQNSVFGQPQLQDHQQMPVPQQIHVPNQQQLFMAPASSSDQQQQQQFLQALQSLLDQSQLQDHPSPREPT